jgi:hypothetical protein
VQEAWHLSAAEANVLVGDVREDATLLLNADARRVGVCEGGMR